MRGKRQKKGGRKILLILDPAYLRYNPCISRVEKNCVCFIPTSDCKHILGYSCWLGAKKSQIFHLIRPREIVLWSCNPHPYITPGVFFLPKIQLAFLTRRPLADGCLFFSIPGSWGQKLINKCSAGATALCCCTAGYQPCSQ